MSFEVDTSGAGQASGGGSNNIDFDGMNKHTIEVVGTQKKAKTVVGFISGYYDLGLQPRPDFEKIYDESKTEEKEAVEKGEATVVTKNFFDNGTWHNDVEVFCKPRTPAKAFALAVDFPQFSVDKGQFFGESNPLPLRLIMGGTWSVQNPTDPDKKMPIVATPFYMVENTNNDVEVWAISNRTTLHKMGEAADLLDENGLFHKEDITKLLGKPMMFKIRVYLKENKGKEYYTEEIKFVSEVPEGLPVPEFDVESIHGVNMASANNPDHVKQLRRQIKNTMLLSTDWEGSVLQKEIEADYAQKAQNSPQSDSSSTQGGSPSGGEKDDPTGSQEGSGVSDGEEDEIPF